MMQNLVIQQTKIELHAPIGKEIKPIPKDQIDSLIELLNKEIDNSNIYKDEFVPGEARIDSPIPIDLLDELELM